MTNAQKRAALKRKLSWFIWDQASQEERNDMMMKDYTSLALHPERNIIIELGQIVHDLQDNFDWSRQDVLDWLESFEERPEVNV